MKKSYLFGLAAASTVLIPAATEVLAEESDGEIPVSETTYYVEEDATDQVEQIYVESEDADETEDADKEDDAAGEDAVKDGNEVKASEEEEKEDSADSSEVTDPVPEADEKAAVQAGEDEVQEEAEIPDPLTLNTKVYASWEDQGDEAKKESLKDQVARLGYDAEVYLYIFENGYYVDNMVIM